MRKSALGRWVLGLAVFAAIAFFAGLGFSSSVLSTADFEWTAPPGQSVAR